MAHTLRIARVLSPGQAPTHVVHLIAGGPDAEIDGQLYRRVGTERPESVLGARDVYRLATCSACGGPIRRALPDGIPETCHAVECLEPNPAPSRSWAI